MKTSNKRKLRDKIWKRDRGICKICDKPINTKRQMTLDHILPKSLGGGNSAGNLRAAHQRCNGTRGNSVEGVVAMAVDHARARLTTEERIQIQKRMEEFPS